MAFTAPRELRRSAVDANGESWHWYRLKRGRAEGRSRSSFGSGAVDGGSGDHRAELPRRDDLCCERSAESHDLDWGNLCSSKEITV